MVIIRYIYFGCFTSKIERRLFSPIEALTQSPHHKERRRLQRTGPCRFLYMDDGSPSSASGSSVADSSPSRISGRMKRPPSELPRGSVHPGGGMAKDDRRSPDQEQDALSSGVGEDAPEMTLSPADQTLKSADTETWTAAVAAAATMVQGSPQPTQPSSPSLSTQVRRARQWQLCCSVAGASSSSPLQWPRLSQAQQLPKDITQPSNP